MWSCGIPMNFLMFAGLICGHYIFDGLFGYQHTTLRPHQDKSVPNLCSISSLKYLLVRYQKPCWTPRWWIIDKQNLHVFLRPSGDQGLSHLPGSVVACPGLTMGWHWSWVCCCHRPPPWLLGSKAVIQSGSCLRTQRGDLTCINWI